MQSDLVYPDHFSSSNDVSLARFLDNQNHKCKERNSFHSKWQQCKQRWQCAVQCNLPKQTLKGEQKKNCGLTWTVNSKYCMSVVPKLWYPKVFKVVHETLLFFYTKRIHFVFTHRVLL